ncbi:MAG: probable sulfite oxidase [uncultured Nocardioidaceae bacterium]|uniref:Probable sulfite oxidase n=1 Tax=uncultured Nocardioidaceae bacterium TaxID=253824 RepID=A0A6J4L8Z7_9ACTN|nr:MAG: probable sulfite oxidase [uncultured Nocardioidaceae bacterium]
MAPVRTSVAPGPPASPPGVTDPSRSTLALGGLAGLLAAGAGVAVSEAVAALLTGVTSPLLSVGNRAVDQAPRPVKEWAIETFGTADKPVLIGGVIATVAVLAILAGVIGVRRPQVAAIAILVLGAVAGAATLTDRSATAGTGLRLVPVLALVVIGLAALLSLLRPLHRSVDRVSADPSVRPGPTGDRRSFLLVAAAVTAVAAVGGGIARSFGELAATASRAAVRLPRPRSAASPVPAGTELEVGGITPYLTSNADFYRVDTALRVPDVPVDGWRLEVTGMVQRELSLSYEDLLSRPLVEKRITLTCVSNPVGGEYLGNAVWLGVPIADLLEEAGVDPRADAVRSRSVDDFTAGTPLSVLLDRERGALVAVGMNGEPLPLDHGFPARMVTPGLYGYVSATKWLVELEVTRFADFKAYWTTRGYSAEAPIKTSSRIDVPRSFAKVEAGRTPVAGVAWAQTRGIRSVEVRVDGGEWQEAELAAEDGIQTWRQWVWQWDATPGSHTLEARATDATGDVQTGRRVPIAPNGATGWDSVNVQVV